MIKYVIQTFHGDILEREFYVNHFAEAKNYFFNQHTNSKELPSYNDITIQWRENGSDKLIGMFSLAKEPNDITLVK